MLDMGFIHDIKKVLAVLPQKRQSLLFSATFSDGDQGAGTDRLLNQPALIEVARRNQTADAIAQKVHPVGREEEGAADAPRQGQRLAPGAGVHAHEARRQPAGRVPG